jgi:anti-anti-sigma factor
MAGIIASTAHTLRLTAATRCPPGDAHAAEVVLSVAGDLDRQNVTAFDACLSRLLGSAAGALLTVDLARTHVLDVGGLNALIAAARRASSIGRPLRLVGCPRQMLRLLQLADAVSLFDGVSGRESTTVAPQPSASTAHTDLPRGRSSTPHAADKPATTSRPRPRGAVTSTRGDMGIEQG